MVYNSLLKIIKRIYVKMGGNEIDVANMTTIAPVLNLIVDKISAYATMSYVEDELNNKVNVNHSYRYVTQSPSSDIDENTYYLTRATRPTYNYGSCITNKVLYPTANIPAFSSLFKNNQPRVLFYNSYDEKYYLFAATDYYGEFRFTGLDVNNNKLRALSTGYVVYHLYELQNGSWVKTKDTGMYLQRTYDLFDVSPISKTKILYTNVDVSFADGNETFTVTNDSTKQGESDYIYANYFSPSTGEYLGDLDNVDENDIYTFNMKVHRDNQWLVVGQCDFQDILEQFAKLTALATKIDSNQGAANAGMALVVGVDGSVTPQTLSNSHNYSTTEQVVGTWIDGKPLYEKTIIYNNRIIGSPGVNGTTIYSLTNEEIKNITNGIATFGDTGVGVYGTCFIPYVNDASNQFVGLYINTMDNTIVAFQRMNASTLYTENITFTIQYTKTTDTAEVSS